MKKKKYIKKPQLISTKNILKNKLIELKKKGFNFPNILNIDNNAKNLLNLYSNYTKEKLKNLNIKVSIAGRIITKRILGKTTFLKIQDYNKEIQIYIKSDQFPNNYYKKHILNLDTGDIINVIGIIFKTYTNELSILGKKILLLTKTLHNLPSKFYGLKDQETKYRKRYLDLICNIYVKKIFQKRSKILKKIRIFMEKKNFLEVETPMMHYVSGGANAKPFITYHKKLNRNMFLRIAPELYLKKLIIGGFNKIFEINRNFRNEGISLKHNPEFTMMEAYIAYSTYQDMMIFLENLINFLIKNFFNSYYVKFDKYKLNFKKPFIKMTMKESILKFHPYIVSSDLNSFEKTKKITEKLKLDTNKCDSLGKLIYLIFEKTIEKKIIKPTFITEYPIEISPLAKKITENKNFTERFEFFICGYEIANGFSELNDPLEQKERFKNQKKIYDKNYIKALEYGLPPTSGIGIGIDRLIMILTNQKNIKDVILFPTLKNI